MSLTIPPELPPAVPPVTTDREIVGRLATGRKQIESELAKVIVG